MSIQPTGEWVDHTYVIEYAAQGERMTGFNPSPYAHQGEGSWGDAFKYGLRDAQPGTLEYGTANSAASLVRDAELQDGFYNARTITTAKYNKDIWSDNNGLRMKAVNQNSELNPWGSKTAKAAGCMEYGTDAFGKPQVACPLEFVYHGLDFQDLSAKVKAAPLDPAKQAASGARVPCPKD